MPLSTGEIQFYGANMHPNADQVGGVGGAINSGIRITFNDISSNGVVEAISTSASDIYNVVVSGRDSAGILQGETLTLNGVTPVTGAQAFSRINLVTTTGTPVGIIRVRKSSDDVTIAEISGSIRTVRRLFINATANAAGGAARQFYEKIFIRNDNLTTALLNASLVESSDPPGVVEFAFESGYNGSNSGTGRLDTVPSSMASGSFDSTTKSFPGATNLGPSSGVGVWVRMTIAGGASATGFAWSCQVNGASA